MTTSHPHPARFASALSIVLGLTAPGGLAAQETAETGDSDQVVEEPDASPARLSFNGFGTLGLVYSSEERADFIASSLRPDGAGFTRPLSPEPDSRLGLQVSAALAPKLSAVVQVVVEQQHDDDIEPSIEWANLKYSFSDDFSLRIGRTALPTFAASDYRKVGYANPWVRPPVELYGLIPVFTRDGIDLSYRHRFHGWTHTLQASVGYTDADFPGDFTVEVRDGFGFFDTFERGDLSIHTALVQFRLSLPLSDLFDAFRSFGPQGEAIADRFEVEDRRHEFAALGATYDPGQWFLAAELGRLWGRSLNVSRTAGYATAGRRLGGFTPYLTYSEVHADDAISSPGLDLSALPPELVPLAAGLNAALNESLAAIVVQRSISAGVRWDYRRNAALKLQVDRVDVGAGSYGSFVERQTDFATGGNATLVTLSTDFVF
jgi:hypothetical protein